MPLALAQPDAEVMLDFAVDQSGKPYTTHRPIQEYAPTYDCSALVIASMIHAYHEAGLRPPPELLRLSNTVDIYNYAKSRGGLVPVEKAVRTRGGILIKGRWWGYGPAGHTGISEGNGIEMAAHSKRSGIHESPIYGGRAYQDGFIDPDFFYADLQPPITAETLAAIKKLLEWGVRVKVKALHMGDPANGDITILNQQLLHRGMLPTYAPMNIFSTFTRDGVVQFKKAHPAIGNIVGKTFGGSAPAVDAMLAAR